MLLSKLKHGSKGSLSNRVNLRKCSRFLIPVLFISKFMFRLNRKSLFQSFYLFAPKGV